MNKYLRYVAMVVAALATSIIALSVSTDGAEARGRYRKHYSKHYGHHRVHHARRYHHGRQRLVINVRRQPTAEAAARPIEIYSESAIQFAVSQDNRAAERPARNYTLKGDGTFGDLVQGSYGGAINLANAAERYLYTNPTGMHRNWCRAFVNYVARREGYRINPSLMARAPTGGQRVHRPVPGAIAQNYRHTGFVKAVSPDGRKILLISGNSGGRGPGHRTTTARWRPAGSFQYAMLTR